MPKYSMEMVHNYFVPKLLENNSVLTKLLCNCFENPGTELHWYCTEIALKMPRNRSETVWKQFGNRHETAPKPPRNRPETAPKPPQNRSWERTRRILPRRILEQWRTEIAPEQP